jgi:hypothetical protein
MLQQYVRTYEHAQAEVTKLKNTYLSKTRKADEAEDEYVRLYTVFPYLTGDLSCRQRPLRPERSYKS